MRKTATELRSLSPKELATREQELRRELFHQRIRNHTNQLDDTSSLPKLRKDIARAKTIDRERVLALHRKRTGVDETNWRGAAARKDALNMTRQGPDDRGSVDTGFEANLDELFARAMTEEQRTDLENMAHGRPIAGFSLELASLEASLDQVFDKVLTVEQRADLATVTRGQRIAAFSVDTSALETHLDTRFPG